MRRNKNMKRADIGSAEKEYGRGDALSGKKAQRRRYKTGQPTRRFPFDEYPGKIEVYPRGARSWRRTSNERFRAKGYVCSKNSPFQNLNCNLSLGGGF
jgi:hypothetical protein